MFCNRFEFEYCNFIFLACNFHESLAIRFLKNYVLFLTDRIKLKLKIIRFRVQSSFQEEPFSPDQIFLRGLKLYGESRT